MKPHFETSARYPDGVYCTCPVGRNHTVHEFYDYVDNQEIHPFGQMMLRENARARQGGYT